MNTPPIPFEQQLGVEGRLSRIEVTVQSLAVNHERLSEQMEKASESLGEKIEKTNDSVRRLASAHSGDKRLVIGFVTAITVLFAVAQFWVSARGAAADRDTGAAAAKISQESIDRIVDGLRRYAERVYPPPTPAPTATDPK